MPDETKTPAEWADLLIPSQRDRWKHAVAEALHGWKEHAYETGAHLQLSRADYEAAIETATDGTEPHDTALSEHAPFSKARAAESGSKRPKPPNALRQSSRGYGPVQTLPPAKKDEDK